MQIVLTFRDGKLPAPAFAEAPALRKASGGGASRRQAQGGASGKRKHDYRVCFPPHPCLPAGRRGVQPTCPQTYPPDKSFEGIPACGRQARRIAGFRHTPARHYKSWSSPRTARGFPAMICYLILCPFLPAGRQGPRPARSGQKSS